VFTLFAVLKHRRSYGAFRRMHSSSVMWLPRLVQRYQKDPALSISLIYRLEGKTVWAVLRRNYWCVTHKAAFYHNTLFARASAGSQ